MKIDTSTINWFSKREYSLERQVVSKQQTTFSNLMEGRLSALNSGWIVQDLQSAGSGLWIRPVRVTSVEALQTTERFAVELEKWRKALSSIMAIMNRNMKSRDCSTLVRY